MPKSVLITQGQLVNYAGSEVITLELAEYFSSKGSFVNVLSNYIGAPIDKEFQKLKNVVLHTSPADIDFKDLDLIWVHHNLIPQEVLELAEQGRLRAKVVFHHMSRRHPLEFPFAAKIEQYLADAILFNSYAVKQTIETKLAELDFKGKVFNNPAPDYFQISPAEKRYRKELKHVLVVSNHAPEELQAAVNGLRERGITVKTLGLSSGQQEYRRITPEDLAWADVVVSIGKTVPYALLSGVPVYCYDHFGGCGYLTHDNFRKAARLNFSGRGFTKKSAQIIVRELVGGYRNAQTYARELHKIAGSEYLLSSKMSSVLSDVSALKLRHNKKPSQADKAVFEAVSKYLWSIHGDLRRVSDKVTLLESEIGQLAEQQSNMLSSKSWKITEPLRQANKLLKEREP